MNEKTLEGYHATASYNVKSIINEGFIESKSNREHWLGRGVYFFENLYYAIEWEIIGVLKQKNIENHKKVRKTDILLAKINRKDYEMIDLSTPYGCDIFNSLLDIIKYNYSEEAYEEILKRGDKYIISVLENLEEIKGEKYLSEFDIVCADYPRQIYKKANQKGNFITCTEKQICVKNIKAIESIQKIEKDEQYKLLYDLVCKNRRKII